MCVFPFLETNSIDHWNNIENYLSSARNFLSKILNLTIRFLLSRLNLNEFSEGNKRENKICIFTTNPYLCTSVTSQPARGTPPLPFTAPISRNFNRNLLTNPWTDTGYQWLRLGGNLYTALAERVQRPLRSLVYFS